MRFQIEYPISGTPSQPVNGVLEGSFSESRLIQVDSILPSDFT